MKEEVNLMPGVTTFSNMKEFFFSTNHGQQDVSKDFVPMTVTLPLEVTPRESLPLGVIETAEDVKKVFHSKEKEIPNPDPNFQPQS